MDGIRNIEELEKKMDGVYDLNEVDDCRKIIGVMLRSIREKDILAQQYQDRLKMLSIMVVNENLKAKEKAQEFLSGVGKSKSEVMGFLLGIAETMKAATEMETKEIIDEVTHTVWSTMDMSSRESAVLGELIERMRKNCKSTEFRNSLGI